MTPIICTLFRSIKQGCVAHNMAVSPSPGSPCLALRASSRLCLGFRYGALGAQPIVVGDSVQGRLAAVDVHTDPTTCFAVLVATDQHHFSPVLAPARRTTQVLRIVFVFRLFRLLGGHLVLLLLEFLEGLIGQIVRLEENVSVEGVARLADVLNQIIGTDTGDTVPDELLNPCVCSWYAR